MFLILFIKVPEQFFPAWRRLMIDGHSSDNFSHDTYLASASY